MCDYLMALKSRRHHLQLITSGRRSNRYLISTKLFKSDIEQDIHVMFLNLTLNCAGSGTMGTTAALAIMDHGPWEQRSVSWP